MSITTTSTKDSYVGNGTTSTPYPITFKYLEDSHITVYVDDVAISDSYYTLTGDGSAGTGQFTTSLEYTPSQSVVVVLDVPFDQPTALQETGALPAKTLEESFDRLNMQIRRVWRKLGDVLTFNTTEDGASTGTADTLIGFDDAGDIASIPNSTFVASDGGIDNIADVTITTPVSGEGLIWNGSAWVNSADGNGDMLKSVYDPTSIAGSAFDMDNMVEGATTKILTNSERSLIASAIQTETNGTVQGTDGTYDVKAVASDDAVTPNSRGEGSVDLMMTRDNATEVPSGSYSALIGGDSNTASGLASGVVGGSNNQSTAQYSGIFGGTGNTATGNNSFVMGGYGNDATGNRGIVLSGHDNTASATDSIAAGAFATASHDGARVFGDKTSTAIASKGNHEFAVQCSNFRVTAGTPAAGKVLTCNNADGSSNWQAPAKVVYTVSTLPASPSQGDVAMVTDATATTFHSVVAGTGSSVVPVFYDGTNWRIG